MPMYVWEDVLEDYTSGLVCVFARSEKQAWEMLYEKDSTAWWVLQGRPTHFEGEGNHGLRARNNLPRCGYLPTAIRPVKVTKPEAFVVWGGG